MTYHKSVLVNEAISSLNIKPSGTYVDVTFGGGGHTRALLQTDPTIKVIGFDWDLVALDTNGPAIEEEFGERVELIWANFSQVDKHLKKHKFGLVDGILADFGTSQFQLTEKAGFSFFNDTVLDMRMSPQHQKVTAKEIVNKASEAKLIEIFQDFGEEPRARAVARAIVAERAKAPINTTKQLALIVTKVLGYNPKKTHPATRIFQALRIQVNKELENIHSFLVAAMRALKPGGRLVCISFHSLEDRMVKQFFKTHADQLEIVSTDVIVPSDEEVHANPSSRSAKMRVAQLKKTIENS